MNTVSVSPKYQVVIPKEIRESINITAGDKLIIIPYDGRIELIPQKSIQSMRGALRGMKTDSTRDKKDSL